MSAPENKLRTAEYERLKQNAVDLGLISGCKIDISANADAFNAALGSISSAMITAGKIMAGSITAPINWDPKPEPVDPFLTAIGHAVDHEFGLRNYAEHKAHIEHRRQRKLEKQQQIEERYQKHMRDLQQVWQQSTLQTIEEQTRFSRIFLSEQEKQLLQAPKGLNPLSRS